MQLLMPRQGFESAAWRSAARGTRPNRIHRQVLTTVGITATDFTLHLQAKRLHATATTRDGFTAKNYANGHHTDDCQGNDKCEQDGHFDLLSELLLEPLLELLLELLMELLFELLFEPAGGST